MRIRRAQRQAQETYQLPYTLAYMNAAPIGYLQPEVCVKYFSSTLPGAAELRLWVFLAVRQKYYPLFPSSAALLPSMRFFKGSHCEARAQLRSAGALYRVQIYPRRRQDWSGRRQHQHCSSYYSVNTCN